MSFAITSVLLIRFLLARHLQPITAVPGVAASRMSDQTLSGAALLALRWRTGLLAVLGLLVAIAIGYARIYVGVHFPGDILCGAIIGLLAAWVVLLARGLLQPVARLAERAAQRVHLA